VLNWRRFFLIQAVIVLLAIFPLLSAFAAEGVANYFGCELHEGFVNPCVAFGQDIGNHLSSSFVMGWLTLITLPLGFIAWCIHIAYAVFRLLRGRKAPNAS